jgi:magnesium transporter
MAANEERNVLAEIEDLMNQKQYSALRSKAENMNEADIAAIMEDMEDENMLKLFRIFPKDMASDIFAMLEPDSQQYIITKLSEKEAGVIIDNLQSDDAVDLLEEMPANVVKKILENARPDTRKDINHLLQYPDDSAGSVMTVEFIDLKEDMNVDEAIQRVRKLGVDSETINTCYVLDAKRKLIGAVALRTLLLKQADDRIGAIMHGNVISCRTHDDEEMVAQMFQKYDFNAMPVVDTENRMVGIITVDDVIDIIQKETTEDIEKMAAIIPTDKPYLKTNIFETWKKRIPWLLLLMISATFTGSIITSYENALSKVVILTAYIPMLMDTGGNAGSQATTEVVRGISLNEIGRKDYLHVIWKEMGVGLLCGLTLAFTNFFKCIWFDHTTIAVAAVVCLTLVCTVFFSKLVGSTLTIGLAKIGVDPAVVASPVLTTIIDALSLIIYFTIATQILGV